MMLQELCHNHAYRIRNQALVGLATFALEVIHLLLSFTSSSQIIKTSTIGGGETKEIPQAHSAWLMPAVKQTQRPSRPK